MKSVEAYSPRAVVERDDRPDRAAGVPAHEWDLEDIDDEYELEAWCQAFRDGNAEINLCGGCGRPTHWHLPLAEWIEHPMICRHCRYDNDG